jgi:DNA-binding NtrC family response regulator
MHKWRQHRAPGDGPSGPGISDEAMQLLMQYSFPGNVRELENLIERALILAAGPQITVADLEFGRPTARRAPASGAPPAGIATPPPATGATATPPPTPGPGEATPPGSNPGVARSLADRLSDQERAEIIGAIERSTGNIAAAARSLGINRSTLYYRLRKHDLLHLLPSKPEPDNEPLG